MICRVCMSFGELLLTVFPKETFSGIIHTLHSLHLFSSSVLHEKKRQSVLYTVCSPNTRLMYRLPFTACSANVVSNWLFPFSCRRWNTRLHNCFSFYWAAKSDSCQISGVAVQASPSGSLKQIACSDLWAIAPPPVQSGQRFPVICGVIFARPMLTV